MTLKQINSSVVLSKPDCILFDLDNTLYPYDPAHNAALNAAAQKANNKLGITREQFDDCYASARKDVKERLGNSASSHSRLLYFQKFFELVGLRAQAQLALDFEQTYWREFLNNMNLFEDAIQFLDDLRVAGISTAIVTDLTTQIQLRKILYLNIDSYFDVIVTSEEAGVNKPNPKPFQLAMHKLGSKPNNIWMIGDNPVNDIQGSRAALNCITFQKNHTGVKVVKGQDGPDFIFNNFQEYRDFLKSVLDEKNT